MVAYIALLRRDRASDYGVEFPDFPGCVTAGRTLEEARRMAAEALSGHIADMAEHGEAIPDPIPLDIVMKRRRNRSAIAFLVEVAVAPDRSLRVNITVPERELRAIDAAAERQGLTRSTFLVRAARRAIGDAA
jgi:predicted RNase H-like HicB family nuclease